MKRLLPRLVRIAWLSLAAISLLICVATMTLRYRSQRQTDVFMIPTGGQTAILFSTQQGPGGRQVGWGELTLLSRWPDPRWGWWSGPGWQNVGPLLLHAPSLPRGPYGLLNQLDLYMHWDRSGAFMTPKDSPSGSIAYQNSYVRATALGFPNTLAPPPDSAVVTGRQLRFSLGPIVPIAAIIPAIVIVGGVGKLIRSRRRKSQQGCAGCGYNLTGNVSGVCPECGAVISVESKC
jgi:hypothetical protein